MAPGKRFQHPRQAVIVDDRSSGEIRRERQILWPREVQEKRFVGLDFTVAKDRSIDRSVREAGGNGERARLWKIIRPGRCCAVAGGESQADEKAARWEYADREAKER